jgi:hypothetical protein
MTEPIRFRVDSIDLFERPVRLRLPFRFGSVTLTGTPQAFVRAGITLETGESATGAGAELMVPKWFDKDPTLSNADNVDQLRRSLRIARGLYSDGARRTAFGHFVAHYEPQRRTAEDQGLNALVAGFGAALIDKAVLDALGRATGRSYYALSRSNALGLAAHPTLVPDLPAFDYDSFLAGLEPATAIAARHTVGLIDPLDVADLAPDERPRDDLPVTLEEVIAAYGHRWFKLKVSGDLAADLDRLSRIAATLDGCAGFYRATLDGNEQYASAEAALELWRRMGEVPALSRLVASIVYIEQPIARSRTFEEPVAALAAERPVIIDEADAPLDAFRQAVRLGYSGVSSKACKGVYRSLINAACAAEWNARAGEPRFFLSGEDLTTQAGLAVQQDLALVSLLGLGHVERNGHHYVDGFAGAPQHEADAFLAAHPDLYRRTPGGVRLSVSGGMLTTGSLNQPGFASGAHPDFEAMEEMAVPTEHGESLTDTNSDRPGGCQEGDH